LRTSHHLLMVMSYLYCLPWQIGFLFPMDKGWTRDGQYGYNVHPWCTKMITNIHNNFGLIYCHSTLVKVIFKAPKVFVLHQNVGVWNSTKSVGSTIVPFFVSSAPFMKFDLECKLCFSIMFCIDVCNARIVCVHSTTFGMSRACMDLGCYDHHVANGTCRESMDIAYQCVGSEVMKHHNNKISYCVGNE
jgi:hypothetical protein